jgi:hypothetical protein
MIEEESGGGLVSAIPTPFPEIGDGLDIPEETRIYRRGPPLDLSGDFTIQFWMRIDTHAYLDTYAFDSRDARAGVALMFEADDYMELQAYYPNDAAEDPIDLDCTTDPEYCAGATRFSPTPAVGEWHFYRIVRSATGSYMRLCVDGALAADDIVFPAEVDFTNTSEFGPTLGDDEFFPSNATFDGVIDDLRMFKIALPCGD